MAVRRNADDEENAVEKVGTRYSVKTPHPSFGIDPNIRNEYGHTNYPKYIEHPWKKQTHVTTTYVGKDQSVTNRIQTDIPERVLVNDEAEEKRVLSEKNPNQPPSIAEGWTKDKDKK